MEYRVGQTATNPRTGQRVVYRNGQWVDAGGGRPAGLTTSEQQTLTGMRGVAEAADLQSRRAQQFIELNRRTGTGGLRALRPPLPAVMGGNAMLGDFVAGMFGPDWDAMKSITSATAPKERVEGSGATSDFEARQMMLGFPSVDKRGDTNDAIADRIAIEQARTRARLAFFERWSQSRGTLAGADQAFNAWWGDYAPQHGLDETAAMPGGRSTTRTRPPLPPSGGRTAPPGLPPAARQAWDQAKADRRFDFSRPRGDARNPYLAATPEILARLPKGSWAIGPDGTYGQVE